MTTDLTVDLGEDRLGRLATACEALGSAKVNINGLGEAGGQLKLLVAVKPKSSRPPMVKLSEPCGPTVGSSAGTLRAW